MPQRAAMGSRIRARRADLGLKQAELARAGRDLGALSEPDRARPPQNRRQAADRAGPGAGGRSGGAGRRRRGRAGRGAGAAAGGRRRRTEEAAEDGAGADFAGAVSGLGGAGRRRSTAGSDIWRKPSRRCRDRLTHDPRLAAALHEVLSVVTAIRATAAILSDTGDLDPEWLDRFHRNLDQDSRRLALSAEALVAYLDGEGEAGGAASTSRRRRSSRPG